MAGMWNTEWNTWQVSGIWLRYDWFYCKYLGRCKKCCIDSSVLNDLFSILGIYFIAIWFEELVKVFSNVWEIPCLRLQVFNGSLQDEWMALNWWENPKGDENLHRCLIRWIGWWICKFSWAYKLKFHHSGQFWSDLSNQWFEIIHQENYCVQCTWCENWDIHPSLAKRYPVKRLSIYS